MTKFWSIFKTSDIVGCFLWEACKGRSSRRI